MTTIKNQYLKYETQCINFLSNCKGGYLMTLYGTFVWLLIFLLGFGLLLIMFFAAYGIYLLNVYCVHFIFLQGGFETLFFSKNVYFFLNTVYPGVVKFTKLIFAWLVIILTFWYICLSVYFFFRSLVKMYQRA